MEHHLDDGPEGRGWDRPDLEAHLRTDHGVRDRLVPGGMHDLRICHRRLHEAATPTPPKQVTLYAEGQVHGGYSGAAPYYVPGPALATLLLHPDGSVTWEDPQVRARENEQATAEKVRSSGLGERFLDEYLHQPAAPDPVQPT